jgi:hypothetical protein
MAIELRCSSLVIHGAGEIAIERSRLSARADPGGSSMHDRQLADIVTAAVGLRVRP